MTDAKPKVSDLVENARKHVEDVRGKVKAATDAASALAPMVVAIDAIDSDLDAIERTLSDVHCDLEAHIRRL